MTLFVMSSVTVLEAAIWVKTGENDKILIKNLTKNRSVRIIFYICFI